MPMSPRTLLRSLTAFILIVVFVLTFQQVEATDQTAVTVQIDAELTPLNEAEAGALQPGLLPRYFSDYFARDVHQLPEAGQEGSRGRNGEPVTQLNHQFGRNTVFGSGTNRGIGVRFRGALYFSVPGTYTLQALSNDGIELFIDETLIISDPKQHSDQLSNRASLTIKTAGWYPLRLDYFQRKGTAALKLYWQTPEMSAMGIIPAGAYAHRTP